jgi:predicted transcriptional regulator of viral defense system
MMPLCQAIRMSCLANSALLIEQYFLVQSGDKMENQEKIIKIAKAHEGIVSTRQVKRDNIRVEVLKKMVKEGKLEKLAHGLYSLPDTFVDEFYLLQKKCSKGVFSYGTSLYFLGLSNRAPNLIHITIYAGYNVAHITKSNKKVKFHYVQPAVLDLGKINVQSPQGKTISIYNAERTLCDIIKDKKNTDMQLFSDAINFYFDSKRKNVRQLFQYAKILGIEDKVHTYTEVFL